MDVRVENSKQAARGNSGVECYWECSISKSTEMLTPMLGTYYLVLLDWF